MRRLVDVLRGLAGQAAGAGLRSVSRRGIVPHRGTVRVPGFANPASIRFDEHGVPHITAASDVDLFRAHGYVHALDRYFQMDMLRRVLRGRLAETVGDRPIGAAALPPFSAERMTSDADAFMRAIGMESAARGVLRNANEEGRALLTAYVEGVNAALPMLRRHRPIEYRALRMPIKPWTLVDSIVIAKGMAFGLSFKWRTAPAFGAIAERLKDRPEHLAHILPPIPGEAAWAVTRLIGAVTEGITAFEPFQVGAVGSNAFLIGADRSVSGKPMIASDPHLELQLPGVWYLSSMSGPTYQAVGCSIPGLPGVVIGRTPSTAWGLTNGMVDDADLWVERLDDAGKRYQVDGAWRRLERTSLSIRRRGAAPRMFTLRRTHRGPLFSDVLPGYAGPALSLRMTLHEAALDLEAFLGLGRARSVGEALTAVEGFGSPVQNLLIADADGNAAYKLMGSVPIRSQEQHPALPRDGTRSDTDWQGFVPTDELPASRCGPDDVVVSANQPQVESGYPHYLSHLYEPSYRAARIQALLAKRRTHSADDLQRIQMDAVNGCAAEFKRHVLEPYGEAARRARPEIGPLLDRLLAWQGDEEPESTGAAPWHLVYHHLVRRTFTPTLGPELVNAWMGMINLIDKPLLDAFRQADNPWAPENVRATLLGEALVDALRDLGARGLTLDSPWGALHTLTLRHPAAALDVLEPTFNQGPFPMRGGPFTVSSGQYPHPRPARMVVGASYRHVVDLADPGGGRMITFGGQSGHAGSPHYADLTPLWRAGEMLPMRLEEPLDTDRRLDLLPG